MSLFDAVSACMYFPMLNFTAVLPLPNRSYAAPIRGVRSLQWTPGVERAG